MDRDCNNCIHFRPMHTDPSVRSCSKWACEPMPVDVVLKKAQAFDSLPAKVNEAIERESVMFGSQCDVMYKSRVDGLNIAKHIIEKAMKDVEGGCK